MFTSVKGDHCDLFSSNYPNTNPYDFIRYYKKKTCWLTYVSTENNVHHHHFIIFKCFCNPKLRCALEEIVWKIWEIIGKFLSYSHGIGNEGKWETCLYFQFFVNLVLVAYGQKLFLAESSEFLVLAIYLVWKGQICLFEKRHVLAWPRI